MNSLIVVGIAVVAVGLLLVAGSEQSNAFGWLVFFVGLVVSIVAIARRKKAWPTTDT
jgi:type IV secretory pathway VirB2 component (pilin)